MMMAKVTAAIENDNNGGSIGSGGSRRVMEAADGHCHKAARAKDDLSILDIPPTIRVLSQIALLHWAALCGVHKGKFGKRGQYLF
jgi:hypothetical protein